MLNSIEDILDVGVSSEKELDLNSNSFVRSDMNKKEIVLEYATEEVTEWFKKGEGLKGNKLRGYTAGNWIDKKNDLKHIHQNIRNLGGKIDKVYWVLLVAAGTVAMSLIKVYLM